MLADLEVVELQRAVLGIESMLRLTLGEHGVIDGSSILMETGLVEDLVKVDLALLAPTDEVEEAAALEPHLILLLFHDILESKLVADLSGTGTLLDILESLEALGLVAGADACLCIEQESLGVTGDIEVLLVRSRSETGNIVCRIGLSSGEEARRIDEHHVLPLEIRAMAEYTAGRSDTAAAVFLLFIERHIDGDACIIVGSPLHLIEPLVSSEETSLAARRVTVVSEELLSERNGDGATVPSLETVVRTRLAAEGVSTPAEDIGNHPATALDRSAGTPTVVGECGIFEEIRLENLLGAAVTGNMEESPLLIGRDKGVVAGIDEVTKILAGSGRVVVEHSGLAGDELGEADVHAGGIVLVARTVALG